MPKIDHSPRGCPIIDPTVQCEKLQRLKSQCPPKQYRGVVHSPARQVCRQQERAALYEVARREISAKAGGEGRKQVRAIARARMRILYHSRLA